jgi:carnitine O-acetyltransferase
MAPNFSFSPVLLDIFACCQMGYLQVRDPSVVNVSYFFHFVDDPTIIDSSSNGSRSNIQRGAAMLFGAAEFRKLVCSGQLPAEKVGKNQTPLCSTAYKFMFNACRIPHKEQDSYRIYDPSRHTHCIVARKGHFFAVELTDPESSDPLPLPVLETQLRQCIEMADEIPSSRPKLGLMTADTRDDWADTREELLTIGGPAMEEALEKLESGAILLNLDDEAPVSRQECGEIFLTGGLNSGENRWFDKSVQIMVANNGKTGLLGEHSMMDGMPLVNLANHLTNTSYTDAKKRSSDAAFSRGGVTDIFEYAMEQIDRPTTEALEEKGMYKCDMHGIGGPNRLYAHSFCIMPRRFKLASLSRISSQTSQTTHRAFKVMEVHLSNKLGILQMRLSRWSCS